MKTARKALKYLLMILAVDLILAAVFLTIADYGGGKTKYYGRMAPNILQRVGEAFKDYVGEPHPVKLIREDIKESVRKLSYKKPAVVRKRKEILQTAAAMNGTLLLDGFRMRYRGNPHRVKLMEASIDGITYASDTRKLAGVANIAFEGGDWSRVDGIKYELAVRPVGSGKAGFSHGSVAMKLEGGRASKAVDVDLGAVGLAGYRRVAVVLRGFAFDTGSKYPDGYTVKGVSVRLAATGREGNVFHFEATAELKAGEAAFRPDPDYDYTAESRIYYTLIGTSEGTMTRVGRHYMLLNRERAPERVMKLAADVGRGPGVVFPAVSGFEFDIHNTKGRYIRELALKLKRPSYDALKGEATVFCEGYLSNEGTFAGALDVRFAADVLFVKLPQADVAAPVLLKGVMSDVTSTNSIDVADSLRK